MMRAVVNLSGPRSSATKGMAVSHGKHCIAGTERRTERTWRDDHISRRQKFTMQRCGSHTDEAFVHCKNVYTLKGVCLSHG